MNRLWIRLSLSYVAVLVGVLIVTTGSIWLRLARWQMEMTANMEMGMEMEEMATEAEMENNADSSEGISSLLPDFVLIVSTTLFAGVLAGLLVSRNIGKQVTKLVVATQAVTLENLEYRVDVEGIKELQDLADSFNRMVDELNRSQQQRRNLLADVSHELLTPLTVLKGNLRAILDGLYALNKEEVSHLYDQTYHMISLVKDLRQLTQAEAQQLSLTLEPTALNGIVEETISLFYPFATEKGVVLREETAVNLPTVNIDRQRIRQVLSNLFSNALRHTPTGGNIIIKTEVVDQTVQISVQDSGEGLDADEVDHIFERFYRADDGTVRRDSGGAGLGLAIVKALVEAHGGTVWAESVKGSGATFTISLVT